MFGGFSMFQVGMSSSVARILGHGRLTVKNVVPFLFFSVFFSIFGVDFFGFFMCKTGVYLR